MSIRTVVYGTVACALLALSGCGEDPPTPVVTSGTCRDAGALPSQAAIEASAPGSPGLMRASSELPFSPLVSPRFVRPQEWASVPEDRELVIGVAFHGEAHAYPLRMMAYHHAANDVVSSVPVLVSYCELCSSATAFLRRVGDRVLTFRLGGTYRGALVLQDEETGSLWFHLTGECFEGPMEGCHLTPVDGTRLTRWSEWKKSHPETVVLRPDPRLESRYSLNKFAAPGEDFMPEILRKTLGTWDPRLPANTLVFGISRGQARVAYAVQAIDDAGGVLEDDVDGTPLTLWHDRGTGAVVAFDRRIDGKTLNFTRPEIGNFRDAQTRSEWTLDGIAVAGTLRGKRLKPMTGVLGEWYGWSTLYPSTALRR